MSRYSQVRKGLRTLTAYHKSRNKCGVLLQLPELILGEVVDKLPIADQERLRLVCKSWRDHLPAQNLGRTVKLLSARDLESRAGRLKSRYPNVVLQVDKISCFNHWDQDQHAFLASPLFRIAPDWYKSSPSVKCRLHVT